MGLLKNIGLSIKTSVGRPLSRADIYNYSDGFIKQPPVPPELRETFTMTLCRVRGVPMTVADYYREEFLKPSLNKIAEAATVSMQRAACIKEIMDQIAWRSFYVCLNKGETDLGKEMIRSKLRQIFPDATNEHLSFLATGFYLVSVTTDACLNTLGKQLLGIDKVTEMQIALCRTYAEEIMMLDVKIMDFIWTNFQDDREHAENLAGWKDDNLNPITSRMNQLLEASKNEIVYGTFDVTAFKQKSKSLDAERAQIADLLRS
jgi:hypothetical protein